MTCNNIFVSHSVICYFITKTQDELSTVAVLHRDDAESCGWALVGKLTFHTKPICDVIFIAPADPILKTSPKPLPRLISLAKDRVSLFDKV